MAVDAPHRALPLPAITYGMLNTISAVAIVLVSDVAIGCIPGSCFVAAGAD
jgi:hypothetical protein